MATWFVTGASRGIGLGICKHLLAKGETVIGACRNPDGARDLWELASDFKQRYRTVKLDVANPADVTAIAREFANQTIDVLVNNAGILKGGDDGLVTMKFEDLARSFEVNTIGPMRVCQALLPALKRSTSPKVANITSKMGSIADNKSGGYYAYRMSKTALNMFNSCFAVEFPQVISLVLHPGWVQTEMGGDSAPVQILNSAEGLVSVIEKATKKDSGSFKSFDGASLPW